MVNTEILAQAMSFGMRIHEVKVSHYPRRYGKPSGANLRVIAKAFRELFRLWGQLRNVTHEQAGLFVLTATLKPNVTIETGEAALRAELYDLLENGIEPQELEKAMTLQELADLLAYLKGEKE